MNTNQVKDIYDDMLLEFPDTLKNTSMDKNKQSVDNYMTMCETKVVNFDTFKNKFIKNMKLTTIPKSCDALYMTKYNELFMIEFKNGIIEVLKNYEIKVKIYESLLILCEKLSQTIEYMRKNLSFILVYNENVKHGAKQFDDTGLNEIKMELLKLANEHIIRFGLNHFNKLYFKEVNTYTKAEFESEFVSKYCI